MSVAVACLIAAAGALAQVPSSQHVVLVIDENSSYSSVVANMPWLVGQGNANGYATNYESDNGGSLLDYLWLASGSCESSANCTLPAGTHNFNCNGNDCYYAGTSTSDPITDDNIFRELNNAKISWKVYAQSYAAAGGTPTTPDNNKGTDYYRRHNGATWYSDILNNVDGSSKNIVDLSQLTTDLESGTLPRFMIIVPDGNHDAHDCPVGMSSCTEAQQLAAADAFLNSTLDPVLNTADFQPGGTGLLLVTFDECGGGTNSGCGASVYTALIGPQVKPHTVSPVRYKHENALRTMLDSLGIKNYPGATATAADMSDFFTTTGSKPEVVISSPAGGASLSSPVEIQASGYGTAGHTITGWWVYVDSVATYNGGAVSTIDPKITMKTGTHTVLVRAWDSSGAYGDETITLTVAALDPTVSVSTPASNATVGSPVNVLASASPTAGQTITGWCVYVDGAEKYSGGATDTISPSIAMSQGTHSVLVRAWDSSGAYGSQTENVTVSSKPAVAVSKPLPGANVISPIAIKASATPSSKNSITGWWVYLDGVGKYQGGAVGSISPSISASTGTHTLLVRAWDSSGAYGDQTFTVDVGTVAVSVSSPLTGAAVTSPANIVASATSAHSITAWNVYVDSANWYEQEYGSSINANLALSPGTHSVTVQAWDSTGAVGQQTITVTVP
ncbi:MAG TPA: alkaline phosphatase family protein [Candidatus Sulfotelmatobacter sp.]|nr:alkaline phosphatase family protein [Candidatus Sulfotelmatobacter sp.]